MIFIFMHPVDPCGPMLRHSSLARALALFGGCHSGSVAEAREDHVVKPRMGRAAHGCTCMIYSHYSLVECDSWTRRFWPTVLRSFTSQWETYQFLLFLPSQHQRRHFAQAKRTAEDQPRGVSDWCRCQGAP